MLKMIKVMLLKLISVIPIWRSKETIQKEENHLEQDITAIPTPDQSGKPDTGRVECGNSVSFHIKEGDDIVLDIEYDGNLDAFIFLVESIVSGAIGYDLLKISYDNFVKNNLFYEANYMVELKKALNTSTTSKKKNTSIKPSQYKMWVRSIR